jgi:uncharacterized protein (DUF1800 family)
MGYALAQIFVVGYDGFPAGDTFKSRMLASHLDVLEKNAFGNFRQLLEDVSLNLAMGYYLSHRNNVKADYPNNDRSKPPLRVPDENYAREVMQLFSIGLHELNMDGTLKLKDGHPIPSYNQNDVLGMARVFTGLVPQRNADKTQKENSPMVMVDTRHSPEEKRFLGVTIPANTNGNTTLRIALDTLFKHPNTAPFISKQLIQRLVTSNPSPAYVKRVAEKFVNNGQGVRGDMKAVIDAILRDEEARSDGTTTTAAAANGWGKLREPVLRYTIMTRNFGGSFSGTLWKVGDLSDPGTELGQSPGRSPSVFNFYRPDYVPPNSPFSKAGLVAPEMQITTETSVAGYVNFMQRQLIDPDGEVKLNFNAELALVDDVPALVQRLNRRLTNESMSPETQASITNAVNAMPSDNAAQKLNRVRTAVLLTVASPEYLVQK